MFATARKRLVLLTVAALTLVAHAGELKIRRHRFATTPHRDANLKKYALDLEKVAAAAVQATHRSWRLVAIPAPPSSSTGDSVIKLSVESI